MSNLPDGVTDAHPHFNPPREVALELECGADEALVIPSFAAKQELNDLRAVVEGLRKRAERADMPWATETLAGIVGRVDRAFGTLEALEREAEYDCPFKGEVDLEESDCAIWHCPVCGGQREADTLPEDQDPDDAYDRMRDARDD